MSHITKVKTRISDKEILLAALDDLGYDYDESRTIYYEGRREKMNVAVWKKGRFSIGFRRRTDDNVYEMHSFGLGRAELEVFHNRLHQQYARKKLLKEARRQNYILAHETVYKDNRIRLVLRKVA